MTRANVFHKNDVVTILHIATHLGGGIGKALFSLVEASRGSAFRHSFLLLEKPEKLHFYNKLIASGCNIAVSPDFSQVRVLIKAADIVQVEWWNHPALFKFLCARNFPSMRLLVWSHQSGIYIPRIPFGLIESSDCFIFTSPCSLGTLKGIRHSKNIKKKIGVVSSGVGLQPPLITMRTVADEFRIGYMGSLNFSKLHPHFVDYLSAVDIPDFQVTVWGDEINRELLLWQCRQKGKPNLLRFTGYTTDVAAALSGIDIFAYLLNPTHYGTAENVLLEAMSAGVVPVVLNNQCEAAIVENRKTGLIVDSKDAFAKAIDWLASHPRERIAMGKNAAQVVVERFTPSKMIEGMKRHYQRIIGLEKKSIVFSDALGKNPTEWYYACRKNIGTPVDLFEREYSILGESDKTKGSMHHFLRYFPDDKELRTIAKSAFSYQERYFSKIPTAYDARTLFKELSQKISMVGARIVNKPLALYGAGSLGKMAKGYFEWLDIPVRYVVDAKADICRKDPFWRETKILFPAEVSKEQKINDLLAVCVVTSPYIPLAEFLTQKGWKDVVPFYDIADAYRNYYPMNNGWFARHLSRADIKNISNVLVKWDDDISRAHHLQFIAWRLLREEWRFDGAVINMENRYFIPEIISVLTDHESFADVGAYFGGVSLRFLKENKNKFRKIYAIEPDNNNLKVLRATFASLNNATRKKTKILERAVGSRKDKQKFFSGAGYASQFSELGNNIKDIVPIDNLGITPSFIKLHLEGNELDALKGAIKTIQRCRPVLVVTAYHNYLGLYELPIWMMQNLTGYRFLMRLHNWCGTGAIVYAIPEEREIV